MPLCARRRPGPWRSGPGLPSIRPRPTQFLTRIGKPAAIQIRATILYEGPLPNLALRVISVRCGVWSLSGHTDIHQTAPIKPDLWVRTLVRAMAPGVIRGSQSRPLSMDVPAQPSAGSCWTKASLSFLQHAACRIRLHTLRKRVWTQVRAHQIPAAT